MDYAQRKSIRGNLFVSKYVMVAISMPSIYTAGDFKPIQMHGEIRLKQAISWFEYWLAGDILNTAQ